MTGRRIKQYDGEDMVHQRVVEYLKWQHKKVIFRTDFAAGIKMTMGQAAKHKRLQYGRAWPDLFIALPAYRSPRMAGGDTSQYFGLFIELKAGNVRLKKRDQTWATDHIREQYEMMLELDAAGYACAFARGFDEAIAVLEWYINGDTTIKFEDFIVMGRTLTDTPPDDTPF